MSNSRGTGNRFTAVELGVFSDDEDRDILSTLNKIGLQKHPPISDRPLALTPLASADIVDSDDSDNDRDIPPPRQHIELQSVPIATTRAIPRALTPLPKAARKTMNEMDEDDMYGVTEIDSDDDDQPMSIPLQALTPLPKAAIAASRIKIRDEMDEKDRFEVIDIDGRDKFEAVDDEDDVNINPDPVPSEPPPQSVVFKLEEITQERQENNNDEEKDYDIIETSQYEVTQHGKFNVEPDENTSLYEKFQGYGPGDKETRIIGSSPSDLDLKNAFVHLIGSGKDYIDPGYDNNIPTRSRIRKFVEIVLGALLPVSFPVFAYVGWTKSELDKLIDNITDGIYSNADLAGGVSAACCSWFINFLSNLATFPEAFPRFARLGEDFRNDPKTTAAIVAFSALSATSMVAVGYVGILPLSTALATKAGIPALGPGLAGLNGLLSGILTIITRINGFSGSFEFLKRWLQQGTVSGWIDRLAGKENKAQNYLRNMLNGPHGIELKNLIDNSLRADTIEINGKVKDTINRETIHQLMTILAQANKESPIDAIPKSNWSHAALACDITLGLTTSLTILPPYALKFLTGVNLITGKALDNWDSTLGKGILGIVGSIGTDAAFFYPGFLIRRRLHKVWRAISDPSVSGWTNAGRFGKGLVLGAANMIASYSGVGLMLPVMKDSFFGDGAKALEWGSAIYQSIPTMGSLAAVFIANGAFVFKPLSSQAPAAKIIPLAGAAEEGLSSNYLNDLQRLIELTQQWMESNQLSTEALQAIKQQTPAARLMITVGSDNNLAEPAYGQLLSNNAPSSSISMTRRPPSSPTSSDDGTDLPEAKTPLLAANDRNNSSASLGDLGSPAPFGRTSSSYQPLSPASILRPSLFSPSKKTNASKIGYTPPPIPPSSTPSLTSNDRSPAPRGKTPSFYQLPPPARALNTSTNHSTDLISPPPMPPSLNTSNI